MDLKSWLLKTPINRIKGLLKTNQMNTKIKIESLLKYNVIVCDTGSWLCSKGDFVFAFIHKNWDAKTKISIIEAFHDALLISKVINDTANSINGDNDISSTSKDDTKDGLYLLNQQAMTKVMNSISGMGMTSAKDNENKGTGSASNITEEFFNKILGGLSADISPLLPYLNTQMANIQAQLQKSSEEENFGFVIGIISVMPVLNVPITNFQYTFSSYKTKNWFVDLSCSSSKQNHYDYKFTIVDYNYTKKTL